MSRLYTILLFTFAFSCSQAMEKEALIPPPSSPQVAQYEFSHFKDLLTQSHKGNTCAKGHLLNFISREKVPHALIKAIHIPTFFKELSLNNITYLEAIGHLMVTKIQNQKPLEGLFSILENDAERGLSRAQSILGWMYENSHGVPLSLQSENDKKAIAWYTKAAQNGSFIALNRLHNMIRQGRGGQSSLNQIKIEKQPLEGSIDFYFWEMMRISSRTNSKL